MRNLTLAASLTSSMQRFRAGRGHPVRHQVGGHADDPNLARAVVDEEEQVEPPEQHRVDVKKPQALRSFA